MLATGSVRTWNGDLPPGRWVVCQTTTEPPGEKLPNGCIAVVRVDGGDTYLRRIKHVDGGWIAATDDSDFEGWKSWEHDLRVIAVAMHAETPLQPSTTAITRDACLDVSEPMNRFQAAPRRAPWKSA